MAIDLFSIGPFSVHGYGLMIGLGFFAAIVLGGLIARKAGLSDDHYTNIAIWVLVIGFLGGKTLYVIVNFKRFIKAPLDVLGSEGFVVYGGIIFAVITIIVYCKIKKLSALDYLDLITMMGALNQAFGRVGCFLAGCCYGKETDSWFGVVFPQGSLAPAGVKLIPTQLIMAAGDLVIFLVLYYIFTKKRIKPGIVMGGYMILYSIGRFLIEFIRNDDERGFVGVLSTSQFIAIWILLASVLYVIVLLKFVKVPEETLIDDSEIEEVDLADIEEAELPEDEDEDVSEVEAVEASEAEAVEVSEAVTVESSEDEEIPELEAEDETV